MRMSLTSYPLQMDWELRNLLRLLKITFCLLSRSTMLFPTYRMLFDFCSLLSPVINYVRILLIDSQVFAEEVEPTGAVPMEISLERYRIAALPEKFRQNSSDPKLKARSHHRLFDGSKILSGERSSLQKI